ncbi:GIY-YIG nuclease family protein [Erwinia tracheiphila]|nr:GIY-YIG nuclease family protein [Erwinia tracheiphila]UIA91538.1 GIY-YIG nuclease family protein [Erwinia tracheiphila]
MTQMKNDSETSWRLYILRTRHGLLYTGITNDISRRVDQHQRGKGAKALRGKGPLELMFHCEAGDRSSASKLEYQVKRLMREDKLRLIIHQPASLIQWLNTLKGR